MQLSLPYAQKSRGAPACIIAVRAMLAENDTVARESVASRRQVQRPRLDGRGLQYRQSRGGAVVAGNTAAGSADAAARPQNRIVGPDERFGGDPRQRRRFSRELPLLRRRMTRAPGRRTDGSDPEPSCRLRGGVLPGPAAPGERSSSRSPRSRLSAPEAPGRQLRLPKQDPSGSGPWRLIISAPW